MGKNGIIRQRWMTQLAVIGTLMLVGLPMTACGKYTEREITASTGYPAGEISQPQIMYGGSIYYYEATGFQEERPDGFNQAGAVEKVDNKKAPTEDFQGARVETGQEIYTDQDQSCLYVKYDQGYARFVSREIDISAEPEVSDDFFLQSGMSREEAAVYVKTFVSAVVSGDRESAAAMISYPRNVKTPAWEGAVNSPEEFLTYYDDIFTTEFKERLENAALDDLFCQDGMISFGEGSLWFYPATETADMSVCTVNVAEDRYVRYGGPAGVQPG